MRFLVTVSGEQAWGEKLSSFLALADRSLSNRFSSVLVLVLVLSAVTLFSLGLCVFWFNMAYGPAANGKPNNAPNDFKGDIKVNNNPPTKEQLEKVADLPVLDVNGKPYTFKSLYADNENGPRRVLVVFVRHFFCGVCLSPFSRAYCQTALTDGYM